METGEQLHRVGDNAEIELVGEALAIGPANVRLYQWKLCRLVYNSVELMFEFGLELIAKTWAGGFIPSVGFDDFPPRGCDDSKFKHPPYAPQVRL